MRLYNQSLGISLFNFYTFIFIISIRNQILNILVRLLNVLYSIEEGNVDQHEGSFEVGKLLKEIYIDSALKKADKLNEQHKKQEEVRPVENISWAEFKKKQM